MHQFSLPRRERLRGKIQFNRIFTEGRGVSSDDGKMRGLYIIIPESVSKEKKRFATVAFAAAVPKKSGNAVWRNRMRRLIKEVFRTEKVQFQCAFSIKGKSLDLVIMPVRFNQRDYPRVSIEIVRNSVRSILNKLISLI